MAHTYDTKANLARGRSSSGRDFAGGYTCGAGATLLVLCIAVDGLTARTGGAPTYNGVALLQADQNRYYASGETISELWYMLAPPTGSALTLHIPDDNNVYFTAEASSYKAASGKTSALRTANGGSGSSTNPTGPSLTGLAAGDVIVACVGDGATTWAPSGRTGVQLYDIDDGSYGDGAQYYITPDASNVAMAWTFGTSSTWGLVEAAFKEVNLFDESLSLAGIGGVSPAGSLSMSPALTFGTGAGVGEGSGGSSLLPTLNVPAVGALDGLGIVDIARSLGLPAFADLPTAALADFFSSTSLTGSGALDLAAAMLADLALTLVAGGALSADGEVTVPGSGYPYWPVNYWPPNYWPPKYWPISGAGPGEYQEGVSLAAVAAAIKTALMDLLAAQSLEGLSAINAAAIIQATAGALFSGIGALTPAHILGRLGSSQFDGTAGVSLGAILQALNSVLLTGSTALTPTALAAILGLLSLLVTAGLTASGGFDGAKDISLSAVTNLTSTLIYEMGAPLGLACLAALTLQSNLTGSNLISLAVTGQMQEIAEIISTGLLTLGGAADHSAAAALGRSGSVSMPVQGGWAAAAELGLVQTCSLVGISSLAPEKQTDLQGFLLLESVGAVSLFYGPRVRRGYLLNLVIDDLKLNLNLK